jgi:hypothetical protein
MTTKVSKGLLTLPIGRNILFNSDFSINQRVYSGGGTTFSTYMYDRWASNASATTMSVSGIICTIDHTTASTNGEVYQPLEGDSLIAGETYVLSWEGTAQGSVYRANSDAYDWQASPIIFTAPSGVDGSSIQEYISFRGDGVTLIKPKLEIGDVATAWDKPDFILELKRCSRYYQKSYPYSVAPGSIHNSNEERRRMAGNTVNGANLQWSYNFHEGRMRITPTVKPYSPITGNTPYVTEAGGTERLVGVSTNNNDSRFELTNQSGATITDSNWVGFQWTADAEL